MGKGKFVMIASLLALIASTGANAAPQVSVVMPFDGAVLRTPDVLLLYQVPAGFKPLVTMDNFKVKEGKLVGGNTHDLHHVDVELKEGLNHLIWTDPESEKRLLEADLYYIPRQSQKRAPGGGKAKEFLFHLPEYEKRCNECHAMPEEMETVAGKPMTPAGKVCSACHPNVGKAKNLHEPSATYDCFRCHQPKYKPTRFTMRSSQAALCGECHQNFTERMLGGKKFVHGPAATGDCNSCHNPHGGEGKGLLREPSVSLCMRCHADTVALKVPNSLHMSVDCDKCHDPHGADNPDLTKKNRADLCTDCHADPMKKYSGHPLAGHPVAAPVDPSKPGRAMSCVSCHDIHGKVDISKQNMVEDQKLQREFCLRCHYS